MIVALTDFNTADNTVEIDVATVLSSSAPSDALARLAMLAARQLFERRIRVVTRSIDSRI